MLYTTIGQHEYPHDIVSQLIPASLKNGSCSQANGFRIEPREGYSGYEGKLCWETALGLRLIAQLSAQEDTVAIASLLSIGNALVVVQMQGKQGCKEVLCKLRWPSLFVEAALAIAHHNPHLDEVRINAAHSQYWYEMPVWLPEGRTIEEHKRGMRQLYDGTARRMHFKWCGQREAYYRTVRAG